MRVEHRDFVHLAAEEFFRAKFRERLRLNKTGGILKFKIGEQFAFCAHDELSSLLSSNHKSCVGLVKVRRLAEQIRIERAA